MTDTLDLALLHRPGEKRSSGYTSERWSADFLVGGMSLFGLLCGGKRDLSGAFLVKRDSAFRRTKANAMTRHEFGSLSSTPVRLALYVCPECGDLGCGALTCDAVRVGDKVFWSNFGFETGMAEYEPDFASYVAVGPFEFEAEQYFEAVRRAAAGNLTAAPRSGASSSWGIFGWLAPRR